MTFIILIYFYISLLIHLKYIFTYHSPSIIEAITKIQVKNMNHNKILKLIIHSYITKLKKLDN